MFKDDYCSNNLINSFFSELHNGFLNHDPISGNQLSPIASCVYGDKVNAKERLIKYHSSFKADGYSDPQ